MTSSPRASAARSGRLLIILPVALGVAFCAGRTTPRTTAEGPAQASLEQLWIEPGDLETRDLFHGAGGRDLAPDPAVPFELVAEDDSGYSPGYDVRGPDGTLWSVKLGREAQPELVVSRVLWAIGYHQPPTYLLTRWQLVAKQGKAGPQELARFRRDGADAQVVSDWSWYENPFVATRPFKGLIVANLILNNWDWKTSNNKVYAAAGAGSDPRRLYVVRDLGASLGKTSFPALLKWPPFDAMAQGSRNDLEGFEEQGFIRRVDGSAVEFHYRGIHDGLLDTITAEDVVWASSLMARISDEQWQDVFRAAAYDEQSQRRYIAKLKSKIGEGLALSDRTRR